MIHNLFINIVANAILCICWNGERNHMAYWSLEGETPDGSPFRIMDGPFPNQYMAAADFWKRCSKWPFFAKVVPGSNPGPVPEVWIEAFGINFKQAFKAASIQPEPQEDVFYCAFRVE